ncbi:hypothetical protein JW859_06655 [bacterium]|nr:hypothetical protein [bacterium]
MKRIILAALALILAGLMPGLARAAVGLDQLYETLAWDTFPNLELFGDKADGATLFPDLQPAMRLTADYAEIGLTNGDSLLTITCVNGEDCYLAAVFYGSDGLSRITHHGLQLSTGRQLTISQLVPADVPGVSRLLVSSRQLESAVLAALASRPNEFSTTYPGVTGERWFTRGGAKTYRVPWQDVFRNEPAVDYWAFPAEYAWCRATVGADGRVFAKDCAVEYFGQTGVGFDNYGTYGYWPLSWSTDLGLVFEMPVTDTWTDVKLVLYGNLPELTADSPYSWLDLSINGQSVVTISALDQPVGAMQHYTVPVSHYIETGANQINIGLNTVSGTEWLLDGIEVWVY